MPSLYTPNEVLSHHGNVVLCDSVDMLFVCVMQLRLIS